jgi:RHH-type transcriptional regulator, rel operon repressor / antitoxin RelB
MTIFSGPTGSGCRADTFSAEHILEGLLRSAIVSFRIAIGVKKRLERLAKTTGKSRSLLAATAIAEYLDVNEWQIAGIRRAITSLDRGKAISHGAVKEWVQSWGTQSDYPRAS